MKSFKLFHEMSINVGDVKMDLTTAHDQKIHFKKSRNYPIVDNLTGNVKKHVLKHNNITKYYTNDHDSGKTLYKSEFHEHNPTKFIPFKHQEQTSVERISTKLLPKNYALHETLNHLHNSDLPLISSTYQTPLGHNMWKKLSHKALETGHHVYYHDGSKIHKTTSENIENHLHSYFDPGTNFDSSGNLIDPLDYEHKHIIIFKHKL